MHQQYHVKITRVADTSVDHAMGHPSKVGRVRYTKTYTDYLKACRERDAWAHTGEFWRLGASDFTAEVLDGPSPSRAEEEAENERLRIERERLRALSRGR